MSPVSALYVGHVSHKRFRPRAHRLRYRIFSLFVDLDELPALSRRLRLFSHNRTNLFALRDRDYLDGSGTPLRAQVESHLGVAGLPVDGGAIRLLTMPRILGFAFNPLSIFFCHTRDGQLQAILYEVNNTFGQRHLYLIPVEDGDGNVRQRCDKAFHVSPFMAMDMRYDFAVSAPGRTLSVSITGSDAEGALIVADHRASRRDLTDGGLARVFFTHPLLTLKVVAGIVWEAGKLWAKRVPVHACPAAPEHPVSMPVAERKREAACI